MSTITTRAGKGSPLTNNEVDANFTNLNTDKAELSGAAFTGAITTTSTVDGRDVATDGSKLDGIEASADVTDTTNVTAAGALMDSEVTNLAQVKAFDSADYATAAQGTTADAALPKSGGAMTGAITTNSTFDGRDVATDGTKLDGIEAGADVTDTANVTAAGALMDSELTAIASVKALNQGVATTDSPTFAALTSTGEITANGGIALGDNDKATFGASDDLEIYHDGTNNRLTFVSANTYIQTDGTIHFTDIGNSEKHFTINDNGAVDLYYDNSKKLATTSTGIDVTGTATMDGLTVDGSSAFNATATFSDGSEARFGADNDMALFHSSGVNQIRVNSGIFKLRADDMRFTAQDGTTERMRIDSSGNVGIGTSTTTAIRLTATTATANHIGLQVENSNTADSFGMVVKAGNDANDYTADFRKRDNTTIMRIRGDGNVGIGTTSPASPTGFGSSGILHLKGGVGNDCSIVLEGLSGSGGRQEIGASGGALQFYRGAATGSMTESMRIDAAGTLITKGGAVFNEDSADVDFRVESNNNTHMLFVDGGNNRVGIGTGAPSYEFVVSKDGSSGIEFGPEGINSTTSFIQFYNRSTAAYDTARFYAGGYDYYVGSVTNALTLGGSGVIANEGGSASLDFRVESDAYAEALLLSADVNRFSLGQDNSAPWGQTSGQGSFNYRMAEQSGAFSTDSATGYANIYINKFNLPTDDTRAIAFYGNGNQVGTITVSTSATAYNTSSDQRLKENIADADDAGSKIDSIQVRSFDWKADGSHQRYGMVAQELQTVAPEAVSAPENPDEMMGVDYSKLVPMLIKEIQSLRNRVAQLEE